MVGLIGIRGSVGTGTLHSVLANGLQAAGFSSNPVSYPASKMFDSVLAFAKGLHDYFQAGHSLSNTTPTCESCSGDQSPSAHGDTLINYLKQVRQQEFQTTNKCTRFKHLYNKRARLIGLITLPQQDLIVNVCFQSGPNKWSESFPKLFKQSFTWQLDL